MKTEILKKSIVGEVSLSYSKQQEIKKSKIGSSKDAEEFIRTILPVELMNHREFAYVIFLDRANNILGYSMISAGGVSSTVIDPKIVFQSALLTNSSGLVLFHNHPSSNTNPSHSDISITQKIKKGGNILDIKLLDHIIITEDGYFSFADEGRL